jgi:hypothetical protein
MFVCIVIFISIGVTQAQSTIFNTPSTDVVSEGQIYLEADFITHLSSYDQGGYQLYGARAVYGVHKRMEFGTNVYYTRSGDSPEPVAVEPNFKWQFYNNEDHGLSAAAGALVSFPVSHRNRGNTSGFLYVTGTKKVKGDFGPRLSVGSYVLAVRAEPGTSKYGTLLGFEQPLNSRLTFISDWTSGKNDLGYLAAGIGINLSPRSALYVGYNVGNEGRRNNALGIYYGFTF